MHEKCQIERIELNNQVKCYHQPQSFILLLSDEAICHPFILRSNWLSLGAKKGRFSSLRSLLRPLYIQGTITKNDLQSLCAVLLGNVNKGCPIFG